MNDLAAIGAAVLDHLSALSLQIHQVAIIGATLLSSEMVLWLPLPKTAKTLLGTLHKSKTILLSKHICDDRKEKIIPFYALKIFKNSLFLPLLIAVLISPIIIVSWWLAPSFINALLILSQPIMIVLMIITSAIYLIVRLRLSR